jgi:hypothetical protein
VGLFDLPLLSSLRKQEFGVGEIWKGFGALIPMVVGPAKKASVEYLYVFLSAPQFVLEQFEVLPQISVLCQHFLESVAVEDVKRGGLGGRDAIRGPLIEKELAMAKEGVWGLSALIATLILVSSSIFLPKAYWQLKETSP